MKRIGLSILLLLPLYLGAQNYFLNGNASVNANGCYNLTPNVAWQNGAVWYADNLDLNESFHLQFNMSFGSTDLNGADGMVFVLQTVGPNALGNPGGGLGFEGFNPSFGIEFDTYQNPGSGDLAADHVAFLKNGNVNHLNANNLFGPVQASAGNANIEDGLSHIVTIDWNADLYLMQLYVDCQLRISYNNNIITSIFGGNSEVYWGFTGSTGGLFNQQSVCLEEFYLNTEGDVTICQGESTEISASGNPGGTFSWSPSSTLSNANDQAPIATPDQTTVYYVTYTDLCGVQSVDSVVVTVQDYPIVDAGENNFYCTGSTLELVGTSTSSLGLLWTSQNGLFLSPTNTYITNVAAPGTYTLSATTSNGCSASDDVEVQEIPLPLVNLGNDQSFCEGSSVTLDAGPGWDAVLWSNNSSSQTLTMNTSADLTATVTLNGCSGTDNVVITEVLVPTILLGNDTTLCDGNSLLLNAGIAGTWSTGLVAQQILVTSEGNYSFTYTNQNCIASDEINVFFDDLPLVNLGFDQHFCPGESVVLTGQQIGQWSTGVSALSIEVSTPGTYSQFVSNGICSASDEVAVFMDALPNVDLGPNRTYCSDETITLTALNLVNDSYLWNTGSTDPFIDVNSNGTYLVSVFNECGTQSDSIAIAFEECNVFIYIPNSFTPDFDGINDVWQPSFQNVDRAETMIFDRWGELVFRTESLTPTWMGNIHNGEFFVDSGAYSYLIKYRDVNGDVGQKFGHLVVLR